MDYQSSFFYGVIQGLTEFLPVSSSGHLALLPSFLHIKDPGLLFDLAMHLGTALSIIVYFREKITLLLKGVMTLALQPRKEFSMRSYILNLILATATTFIFVLLFKKSADLYGRNPQIIAFNLILFGIFMFLADSLSKAHPNGRMMKFHPITAFLIGLFQFMAIFPGVSRSGATLTISRVMRLSREESTEFSFLLSLPIIIGGFFYQLPEFLSEGGVFDMETCLVGMAISFIVGLLTIHYFLKLIKKIGLGVFSFYRFFLGIFIFYYLS